MDGEKLEGGTTAAKATINIKLVGLAAILGLVVGIILFFSINYIASVLWVNGLKATILPIEDDAYYAYDFRMECTANPSISMFTYTTEIPQNAELYTGFEFVMEAPRYDLREKGMLYFSPGSATQGRLDFFNAAIALQNPDVDSDSGFPIAMDRLIGDHESMMALCDGLYGVESGGKFWAEDIRHIDESRLANLRTGLYAKTFLFQADVQGIGAETMAYMKSLNTDDEVSVSFVSELPGDYVTSYGVICFYPNRQGHTQRLIDNLNAIVAESPELLEDSSLTAPLTMEDVVNERTAVWQLITRMDSGQIARFRSH